MRQVPQKSGRKALQSANGQMAGSMTAAVPPKSSPTVVVKVCAVCGTSNAKQWRKRDPAEEGLSPLCVACYKRRHRAARNYGDCSCGKPAQHMADPSRPGSYLCTTCYKAARNYGDCSCGKPAQHMADPSRPGDYLCGRCYRASRDWGACACGSAASSHMDPDRPGAYLCDTCYRAGRDWGSCSCGNAASTHRDPDRPGAYLCGTCYTSRKDWGVCACGNPASSFSDPAHSGCHLCMSCYHAARDYGACSCGKPAVHTTDPARPGHYLCSSCYNSIRFPHRCPGNNCTRRTATPAELCDFHSTFGPEAENTRNWQRRTRRLYIVEYPAGWVKVGVEASGTPDTRVGKWVKAGGILVDEIVLSKTDIAEGMGQSLYDLEYSQLHPVLRSLFDSPDADEYEEAIGSLDGLNETYACEDSQTIVNMVRERWAAQTSDSRATSNDIEESP